MRFKDNNGDEFPKWNVKFGNDIFQNISDKNHNSELPILAITQEYGAVPRDLIDYKISVTDKSIESYKVVQKGDFIISLRSFQGGIEYSEYKGICSPAYIILRPSVPIDNIFYKYYLKTPKYITHLNRKLEGIRDGKMISYKYFSDITLPLPSIAEQNKISSFLSLIEARIQTQKKIISHLETLMNELRERIFSQKLRFIDDLGHNFPKWNLEKLGNVGTFFSGGTPFTSNKNYYKGNIPFIKSGEICSTATTQFISEEALQNSSAKMINRGDLLYALYGATSGEVGLSKIDGAINQAILCIRTSLNSLYLLNYLKFKKENILNTYLQGGQGNLSADIVKSLIIPVPNSEEQTKIAQMFSSLDIRINLEKDLLLQYENQKKYLLANLFV
ncbi:restriction endonuclease subunit S [Chryseobacterium koreense]|uniref:restriction endonuclease subunit S n=1 Tax=Chryseobacterium koreense TaxID=232216 RepID=UPI0026F15352|nr:restriction endonuclease subunit S [Chryseobacterium koreense]